MSSLVKKPQVFLSLLPYGCVVVGPLLASTGLVRPELGFQIFLAAGLFGLVNAVMGLWSVIRRKFIPAVVAGVGVLPLFMILGMSSMASDKPLINDITTDFTNPIAFVKAQEAPANQEKDLSYPSAFEAEQKAAYPDIEPVYIAGTTPDQVLVRVRSIVEDMENTEVVYHGDHKLEATQTSGLFRFVDDFVIRAESTPDGVRIDVRSRSRVGKGDFGVNAARIQTILEELKRPMEPAKG